MRIDGHEKKGNVMPGRKVKEMIRKLRKENPNSKAFRNYFQTAKFQYQAHRNRVRQLFRELESTWKTLYATWHQLYGVARMSAKGKTSQFEFLKKQSQMLKEVYSNKRVFLESEFP